MIQSRSKPDLIPVVPNALPKSAKVRKFTTGHLPEKCFV
jgi:hypothetical protein